MELSSSDGSLLLRSDPGPLVRWWCNSSVSCSISSVLLTSLAVGH